MIVKPDFDPKQAFIEALYPVFAYICAGLYFVIFDPDVLDIFAFGDNWRFNIAMTLLYFVMFLVPVIMYFVKYATYRASVYDFKSAHVEYSESFFNEEEKELTYDRVIEVVHTRNILQRMFGTGTIVLHTQATASSSSYSGLKIPNMYDSYEVYK
jgi:membrane protein YdbS with pleckstrin-like domain